MEKVNRLRVLQVASVAIMAALITVDIIFDHKFTESSNDWAVRAQDDGGDGLRGISIFFSTVMTYWVILFLHFYMIFNTDVAYFLYIITIFAFSLLINYVLKAIYYRGRPYAMSDQLFTECACDPGMPSGHTDTAVMAYIILYKVVYSKYLRYRDNRSRIPLSLLLFAFSVAMSVFVMLAMIYTGVHSYSQVLIGSWIAVTLTSLITFRNWMHFVYRIRCHIRLLSVALFVTLNLFTLLMLFINSYLREKPDYWVFFDQQCPDCNNTWVYGQTRAIAATYFLPVYYFFFPFASIMSAVPSPRLSGQESAGIGQPVAAAISHHPPGRYEVQPLQQPHAPYQNGEVVLSQTSQHVQSRTNRRTLSDLYIWRPDHKVFSKKEQVMRYAWLLLASAPGLILLAVYFFGIQPSVLDSSASKQLQSIIIWLVLGILASYLAWACTYLKDYIFFKKGLLTYNDRLYFDDLKQRLDHPEIDPRASPHSVGRH